MSHLCREGTNVTALDNRSPISRAEGCHYINDDIRNKQALTEAVNGQELIIHLAGVIGTEHLFRDPVQAVEINVIGTLNLLEVVRQTNQKIPIVILGKTNEWNNIYSLTSQAVEKAALTYNEHFGMDIRVLRTWNPFGPGQIDTPVQKLIPRAILNALRDRDIFLFGGGYEVLQLTYIDDLVDCVLKFAGLNHIPTTIFEYDLGHRISVKDVVSMIVKFTQSKSKLKSVASRIGETPFAEFKPASPVSKLFPVKHHGGFADNLQKTIDWQRKFGANG